MKSPASHFLRRCMSSVTVAALLFIGAAHAAEQSRRFDIEAQQLASALLAFSQQSRIVVVAPSRLVKNKQAPGISGEMSPAAAMEKLLAGSGLTFTRGADGQMMIVDKAALERSGNRTTGLGTNDSHLMLAAAAGQDKPADDVEEMLVEGEREKPAPFSTANLDLARSAEDPLPFQVFTDRDIALSGASNIEEFLFARLPQNTNPISYGERDGTSGGPGGSVFFNQIDMRGWGRLETLILVNGRRLPHRWQPGVTDAGGYSGDFRGIPIASIERVEILSSAAGAMYGSNATGGVINIITRQDFRGGQVALNYDAPLNSSASRYSGELTYSQPVGWGTTARLTAGLSETRPMRVADRADITTLRWRNTVWERNPDRIIYNYNPPLGATPNIQGYESLFGDGSPDFTSVPAGYSGGQGMQPFLNRQGVFDLALAEAGSDGNYSRYAAMGPVAGTRTFNIGLDKQFAPDWRLSLDYRYLMSENDGDGGYMYTTLLYVDQGAAVNPFDTEVMVVFDDPRMDRPELRNESFSRDQQFSATLRGRIGAWRGIADVSYARNWNESRQDMFGQPLMGWTDALLTGAYDPFVDMRTTPPAQPGLYEEYIMYSSDQFSGSNSLQATLKFSGPLLSLPAGALQFTAGVEHVKQKRDRSVMVAQRLNSRTRAVIDVIPGSVQNYPGFSEIDPPAQLFSIESQSLYAEAVAPLASRAQRLPLLQRLEVFGSGRISAENRDGFRTNGSPVEAETRPYLYALGLRADVIEGLGLRASKSIGFRPPTLAQMQPNPPPTSPTTVQDRRRGQGDTLGVTEYLTGGNPDLEPETTDSINFGVIIQPRVLREFRLSLDYVENIRNDAITPLGLQTVLDLEARDPVMAGRVQRAAPEPGAPNGVGALTFVDARNINFRKITSRSVDLALEQRIGNLFGGNLFVNAAVTRQLSFKFQTSATTQPAEQLRSINAVFARQIVWNGNAQLRWEGARWLAGWSTRYYDYLLAASGDLLIQGSDRADWALTHDALVGYQIPSGAGTGGASALLSGTSVSLGVKNVFDREPRFWAADNMRGTVSYDGIAGRTVWLQVRKSFE